MITPHFCHDPKFATYANANVIKCVKQICRDLIRTQYTQVKEHYTSINLHPVLFSLLKNQNLIKSNNCEPILCF